MQVIPDTCPLWIHLDCDWECCAVEHRGPDSIAHSAHETRHEVHSAIGCIPEDSECAYCYRRPQSAPDEEEFDAVGRDETGDHE